METIASAQELARRRLPKSVYRAVLGGKQRGITLADNVAAFDEVGFAPPIADLPADPDLRTTVMGQDVAMPVLISPAGVQAVHPEGEVAVARAAVNRDTAIGLSSFASKSVEAVAAANPKTFFQLYWIGGRDEMADRVERARQAGAVGLIATLDWAFADGRDWGSARVPDRVSWRSALRFAPEVLARPRWLAGYLSGGQLPDLTVPNLTLPGDRAPTFAEAYARWIRTPLPSWDDLAWLREQWDGPFMLKGIVRVDDAMRTADAGYSAISVSNHGGNNLDGVPASLRCLPAIAEAVGDQVEVLLDGGVRRGSDVAKALALGARAVMIGRAYLWGLAAGGQHGVEQILDILRDGLAAVLTGLGKNSIAALGRDDLVMSPDFERRLGVPVGKPARAPRGFPR